MGTFLLLWALSWRKGLDVIHRQFFHLFIQCFLYPWAESACANAVHYLSFKGIMIHHPLFLLAPSKVIPSPASYSLIRIQRLQEKLISSALLCAFKEIFHCSGTFYHLMHVPTVCAYSGRLNYKNQVICQSKQGSVPCSGTFWLNIFFGLPL